MLCSIADLITYVPDTGDLVPRCLAYGCDKGDPQIVICPEKFRWDRYDPRLSENTVAYMEAAYQFYMALVAFSGFYLHASAVVLDGKAYLFSGPCRAGKSTHTRLWQQAFGTDAQVINDDKPALRLLDGTWYAYGTPWCGKDGINANLRAPLAGVCFLKQAQENTIRRLSQREALQRILSQTIYKFSTAQQLDSLLQLLDAFLRQIPVYELENRPELAAVQLSFETMRQGAQEAGL